jgi:two-component system, chemotaxis family, chemotaxis protein CheY
MKLLIVEDNASARRLIETIVARVATQIHECADGDEALEAYMAHRPDFVLMDLAMERMDGITATRRIMAFDPAARVIIVTQYDQADLREAAKAAGASGYVWKENLLEIVRILQEER